ncbi:MAG: hypothetical protein ACOZB0_12010 [Pseudomonadota bacterium]
MLIAAILIFILTLALYVYVLTALGKRRKFALLFVFAVSPFFAYKAFQFHWYAQALPPEIKISYPIAAGEESGFREGCSVAVYKLTASSLEAIQKHGLPFFDRATQARGYSKPSDRNYHYYTYKPWKETPIPEGWGGEGSLFMCSVISSSLEHEIAVAAKQSGAFYTTKDEAQLLVIPSLGYVVFSSYG